jgi:hypothetical protein
MCGLGEKLMLYAYSAVVSAAMEIGEVEKKFRNQELRAAFE